MHTAEFQINSQSWHAVLVVELFFYCYLFRSDLCKLIFIQLYVEIINHFGLVDTRFSSLSSHSQCWSAMLICPLLLCNGSEIPIGNRKLNARFMCDTFHAATTTCWNEEVQLTTDRRSKKLSALPSGTDQSFVILLSNFFERWGENQIFKRTLKKAREE